jgi:hypothetical protein
MLEKIMKILGYEKLSKIKIQESFKNHLPRSGKMVEKYIYYLKFGKLEQPIVVNSENILIDGFTTYIIAKNFNKKYVKVNRKNFS